MPAREIIIGNACVITGDGPVFPDGFIHIRGGLIEAVGPASHQPRTPKAMKLDAGGRYVLPGFINPHMHLYGLLSRGMPVGRLPSFGRVLQGLWWKLDRALSRDDVFISAMLGGIEAIRAGVTTICDHHASYGATRGSLRAIAKALDAVGLRATLCYEISDRNGKRARDEALAESGHCLDEMRARAAADPASLLRAMVGLHASMTLSDGTLDSARELMDAYGVGAHVHVAEGVEDVATTKRLNGMTPVARFTKAGILRPGTLAAHCVHVDRKDIELLRKSGATVVHNPLSNFNNAVGMAPVLDFFAKRIPVAIGTDGMSAGVAGDIRAAAVIHKDGAGDAQAGGAEFCRAVWETAPEVASVQFGMKIGSIGAGDAADVIVADAIPPTEVNERNAWWHLVYGVLPNPVRTTIVAGEIRMRDGKLIGVDESAVAAEARGLAARLWKRIR